MLSKLQRKKVKSALKGYTKKQIMNMSVNQIEQKVKEKSKKSRR